MERPSGRAGGNRREKRQSQQKSKVSPVDDSASCNVSLVNSDLLPDSKKGQLPKDYSFRLFENGRLVQSSSSSDTTGGTSTTQSSLTSSGGNGSCSMTSETGTSTTASSSQPSLPPALPPKKSKNGTAAESIYENGDVTAADESRKRSIAERKQYFEALSASQENLKDLPLKTNQHCESDEEIEDGKRVWQRNFVL